jgi:pilus assembly protein CpaC
MNRLSDSAPLSTPRFLTKIITCLIIASFFVGVPAHAQSSAPANKTAPASDQGAKQDPTWGNLINGYGENLRPKTKRSAAAIKQPYTPITNLFDQNEVVEIEMYAGESRVFPAPGIARVAVGNGAVLSAAALDSREIIVFANATGTSSLFIWNEDGRYQRVKINVGAGDTARISKEVSMFLATIPNTKTSVIGDNVIVEGDDLSEFDLAKIAELKKIYPKIVNFTNRRTWEQMVFMDVKVVEFPKNLLRELGLKWGATGGAAVGGIWFPGGRGTDGPYQINIPNNPPISNAIPGNGPTILPSGLNILSAINLGLSANFNASELDGKSVLLAEPQLTARSGAKATFLAGGELPYTVSTVNGPTVQFKQYGVKLAIEPTIDRNGAIRAVIDTEVSSIDPTIAQALLTRKTTTEFNVNSGETLVLSGFIKRNNTTSIDKVPFLGDLPILGALFRSKRFQNDETELVIFVTPTIVDARSPALADRADKASQRLQQNYGSPPYISEPLQPGMDYAKPNLQPPKPAPQSSSIAESATVAANTTATPTPEPIKQEPVQPVTAPTATVNTVTYSQSSLSGQAAPSDTSGNKYSVVKLNGLALRSKPSLSAPILRHLREGERVQVFQQDKNVNWTAIEIDGKRGWSATDWLRPE